MCYMYMRVPIYVYMGQYMFSEEPFYTPPPPRGGGVEKLFVSSLAQLQSHTLLPGGGGG